MSSCGAINSAALLLRSRNDQHPRGLANSSDSVGRHYMGHVNSVLMALSKCPNPTIFQKSLSLNDFYFGAAGWNYPMGHISFVGKLDGETLKGGAPALVLTNDNSGDGLCATASTSLTISDGGAKRPIGNSPVSIS